MAERFHARVNNARDLAMKISTTLAAMVGSAALAACGGATNEDAANVDNGLMIENLGTSDMNMSTDMNMGTDVSTGSTDMNTETDMDAAGDSVNDAGIGNTTE